MKRKIEAVLHIGLVIAGLAFIGYLIWFGDLLPPGS